MDPHVCCAGVWGVGDLVARPAGSSGHACLSSRTDAPDAPVCRQLPLRIPVLGYGLPAGDLACVTPPWAKAKGACVSTYTAHLVAASRKRSWAVIMPTMRKVKG